MNKMNINIEEIENRLVGLDEEIHGLLQYISRSKKSEVEVELRDYEDLKKKIARDFKKPFFQKESFTKEIIFFMCNAKILHKIKNIKNKYIGGKK